MLDNLTWTCDSCRAERPDSKISVLSYPILDIPGMERNLKYCNDNYECYEKALLKSQTKKV